MKHRKSRVPSGIKNACRLGFSNKQVGRLKKHPGESLEGGKYLILSKGEVSDPGAESCHLESFHLRKTGSSSVAPEVQLQLSCLTRQLCLPRDVTLGAELPFGPHSPL